MKRCRVAYKPGDWVSILPVMPQPGEPVEKFKQWPLGRVVGTHTDGRLDVETETGETKTYSLEQQQEGDLQKLPDGPMYSAGQTVEVLSVSHDHQFVEAYVVNFNDAGTIDVKYSTGETKVLPWQVWSTQIRGLELKHMCGGGEGQDRMRFAFMETRTKVRSWDITLIDFLGTVYPLSLPTGMKVGSGSYSIATHGAMTLRQLGLENGMTISFWRD
mmetsp:Transcript_126340/g.252454  ORF Transcript_126340/g.252454 Transcript_126340/m.252454 type:complete len:216 (-) Transcript_126340:260-907(-)